MKPVKGYGIVGLEKRYGNIEKLNEAWGTNVWSQHYEAFHQVPQPFKTPAGHSPSLSTAYRIFSRDCVVEFVHEQVDIIRSHSCLPITHNSSPNHYIDNEKIFNNLDFASFDYYSTSAGYNEILTCLDIYKSLKPEVPFYVMETSPSFSGNSYGYQTIHNNGFIAAEAAAAYAKGAKGFCYWLWRQQRSGIEQTHGSILNSWGMPSVGFDNVVKAGMLKNKLEQVLGKTEPLQAELGVSYSDRARTFFLTEPMEDYTSSYVKAMMEWHEMILKTGINCDFIFENNSFEGYRILMTPFMPYVSEEYMARAIDFVEKGGVWVVGPVTGVRTCEQTINVDHALGKLEEIGGVKVVYHYPMTRSNTIGKAFGVAASISLAHAPSTGVSGRRELARSDPAAGDGPRGAQAKPLLRRGQTLVPWARRTGRRRPRVGVRPLMFRDTSVAVRRGSTRRSAGPIFSRR